MGWEMKKDNNILKIVLIFMAILSWQNLRCEDIQIGDIRDGIIFFKPFYQSPGFLVSCYDYAAFNINASSDLKSITKTIDSLERNSRMMDSYILLVFESMNEKEIDNAIFRLYEFKSLKNVHSVSFVDCDIKYLPFSLRYIKNLEDIAFFRCNKIESLSGFNSNIPYFQISFINCHINKLPRGIEEWSSLLYLYIINDDDFSNFDVNSSLEKFKHSDNLISLMLVYKHLNEIPKSLLELKSLRYLGLFTSKINKFSFKNNKLNNLKILNTNINEQYLFETPTKCKIVVDESKDFSSEEMVSHHYWQVNYFDNFPESTYMNNLLNASRKDLHNGVLTITLGGHEIKLEKSSTPNALLISSSINKKNKELLITISSPYYDYKFEFPINHKKVQIDLDNIEGSIFRISLKDQNKIHELLIEKEIFFQIK